ncbi:MAG: polysaccharide biosynthesis/export family protein [Paludibacteraceae bacterium]
MLNNFFRKNINLFFVSILSVFALGSCITAKKVNYLQKPSTYIPSYDDSVGYEEYKLSQTDKLFLRLYSPDSKTNAVFNGGIQGMQALNSGSSGNTGYSELYTYTIDDNGEIQLPITGNIFLEGLTIREAKQKIQTAIQSIMLDECYVDLRITDRFFSVIGGSTNGRYPIIREKMNIFQALALTGDISTFGDRGHIKLLRETADGTTVSVFDIRSKDIINSDYYYIQPNDVIYIQDVPNQFFSVTTFGNAMSTTFTTISFGALVFNIVKSIQDEIESKTATPQQ